MVMGVGERSKYLGVPALAYITVETSNIFSESKNYFMNKLKIIILLL